jgi:oxygen-independent coproporphyrinogen III oxidase
MASLPTGLYIHIPFCQVRCSYCDFNTYAGLGHLAGDYVSALCREIANRGNIRSRVSTIYFGGGTPSLLSIDKLSSILDACYAAFDVGEGAEITIEANPGTVSEDAFKEMRRLGINRLSLGVQSFDDAMLRILDRLHSAEGARTAYHAARRAGFDNISLDFMYGLPGQSLQHWRQTLTQAIALRPEHLSLYALTLESHVPMAQRVAGGELTLPDDDSAADMYTLAEDVLEHAGYVHYEISNWAIDRERASHHNSLYWRRVPYHGFGAGAHSFDGRQRFSNVLHPHDYIKRITTEQSTVAESETITPDMAMSETMFLGLRLLLEGVAAGDFAAQHGRPWAIFASQINDLVNLGLLERTEDRIVLSRRGRLLSNQVFVRFV